MKTKNILVLAALIFSSILNVNGLFAESPTDNNVTLNIVLNPIQSIVVNPVADHKTVDLVYTTMKDYNYGVSKTKEKHLTVFSTGGFEVKVISSGEYLKNGTTEINASDVTVLATNVTGDVTDEIVTPVSLSGSEQKTLISSKTGGRILKYDVTYNNTAGKNGAYLNLYKKEGGTNTFTTTVTYTIAAM